MTVGGAVLGTSTMVTIAPTSDALSENYFSVKAVAPAHTTHISLGLNVNPLSAIPGTTDMTLRIGPVKACKLRTFEGSELVLNGDFSNGLADWVATGAASLDVASGELEITTDGGNKGAQSLSIATQVGAVYRITGRGRKGTASFQLNWTNPNQAIVGPSGSTTNVDFTAYFLASTTSGKLFPFTTQAGICYFDNFSMKLLSAGYLPAYPIMPPAGTLGDSTRSADLAQSSNFDWYDGADCDTGASVLVTLDLSHVGDGVERTLFELSDGTGTNAVQAYISAGDRVGLKIIAGGVTQVDAALVTTVSTGNSAFGFGWSVGRCYVTNGSEIVSADAAALPVITQQRMGCAVSAAPLNDMLRLVQTCVRLSPDEARDWALSR